MSLECVKIPFSNNFLSCWWTLPEVSSKSLWQNVYIFYFFIVFIIFIFTEDFFFIVFRDWEREGWREREKNQCEKEALIDYL